MPSTVNSYMVTDLGNVSLNPKGKYDESEKYEYLDLVYYNGGSYVCLAPLGETIKNIAPTEGQTTVSWQCIAIPGDITPEYTDMYNEVVSDYNEINEKYSRIEEINTNVETIKASVETSESNAKLSETKALASETKSSEYEKKTKEYLASALQSNSDTQNIVSRFNSEINNTLSQVHAEINNSTQQSIQQIIEQQNTSVNQAKSQIDEYIQSEKTVIYADLHQITDDFNAEVVAKKQEIIGVSNEKIQEMTNIYNDFSELVKNVATSEEINEYIGLE